MIGFAVLSKARDEDVFKKHPVAGKMSGIKSLLPPFEEEEYNFNGMIGSNIAIPRGFERIKIKSSTIKGTKKYGHVLSKDYKINFNPFFYHSCLIRALDFYTISMGCDLRISEVVIADAASYEGRNAFRLLLPLAKRILLVTDRKEELLQEVDYAIIKYGTSVGIIENAEKAVERADIIVLSSDNEKHRCLIRVERPMLYFRFIDVPKTELWFNKISISFDKKGEYDPIFAQGYVDVTGRQPVWRFAEAGGFRIKDIKKDNIKIMER